MRIDRFVATCLAATALLTVSFTAQHLGAAESARLVTYQRDGNTYYALSLMPELDAKEVDASAVVVLFDTSASQQGVFRESAMAALDSLLSNLRPGDQVELLAVDLDVKPMTPKFAAPGSAELRSASALLHEQVPLGSTDLVRALKAATNRLATTKGRQRSIVYIGDGISVANLLDTVTLNQVVDGLRESQVSVTSYAVGPKTDAQLLAVLANHTGGNLYVQPPMVWQDEKAGIDAQRAQDENMRMAEIAGKQLANWTHAAVLWPKQVDLDAELGQVYPAAMPPLRSDRDSILLGLTSDQLPKALSINITATGQNGAVELAWTAAPEASQEDHAFLAEIIDIAKSNEGMSLPTLGSAGLAETARLVGARMDQLTALAQRAVAVGDHDAAKRIAESVLRADPGNFQARTVQHVVEELAPAHHEAAAPENGDLILTQPDPAEITSNLKESSLLEQLPRDGAFLDQVEEERRVYAEMLDKEIQNTVINARKTITSDPQAAIQDLKLALDNVKRAAELDAAKRAELISKLQTSLKEAHYQASMKDEFDRLREENLAAARETKLLNERLTRKQEREKQLMDRFSSLIDERRYEEAIEVAQIVEEIDENGVAPRVATHRARLKRGHYLQQVARAARHQAYFDTIYQIELSHIPFPDDPPIIYPDAEYWEALTVRRKKWASVDLSARSKSEERIQSTLREPLKAPLEFEEQPLSDAMAQIADEYQIPIQFDNAALDEIAISPDTEVTLPALRNVTLRSALNIMLKQPGLEDLTYIIEEEVLLITTEERANESLKVKVYPVADLVLPIQNLGLGGGGGGGIGGGGGGFGGGGGAGGGGGFGGGGGAQGGGGGGGFFNVADDIKTDTSDNDTQKSALETKSDDTLSLVKAKAPTAAKSKKNAPAALRQKVRNLMKSGKTEEVIELIQTSLRQGNTQSWMYETLGIAMELAGHPKNEIERAIMSACDFVSSPDELLLIARYLSHIGLDARAVTVYRQIAKISPMHREAYALGLRAAQRVEDFAGIRWATTGILSHAWPREQDEIRRTAIRVAQATLEDLKSNGDEKAYTAYLRKLNQAVARDVVVRATWSGDADIDLIVEEPGGTICSLQEPRTSGGGVCLGDSYASYDKADATFSEEYVCAKAFPGTYRVRIRKVWGKVVAGKVTIDVYKGYNTEQQVHERQHITVQDDSDSLVVFEVEDGRRTQQLEAERLDVAVKRQEAISQAVLAQHLGNLSDPRIIPDRNGELARRRRLALAGRGAVGFQPIIQVLPEGTTMIATAVISPDRRYVRITAAPNFSGIGNVTSFTFAGAAGPAGGGGLGGGGGGGGFGGGGGGGFGGGGGGFGT